MQTLGYRVAGESESRLVFYAKEIFIQILPVFDGQFISLMSMREDTSEEFRTRLSGTIVDSLAALNPGWTLIDEEHEFPGMIEAMFTLAEKHRIALMRILREVRNQYRNELTAISDTDALSFLLSRDAWMCERYQL